jgi:hypothetical protein
MKNVMSLTACYLMIPAVLYSSRIRAGDFKLVKQDQAISLYERWIPSAGSEKVRELKAVFVVRADMASVVQLLKDQDKGIQWNAHAAAYKIIETSRNNCWLTYTRYSLPWPFDDQDCCLLYQCTENNGLTEINFKSAADSRFPVTGQTDRITGIHGKWLLKQTDKDMISVTYLITTDRSKKVPRWISDAVIHSNLFKTMTTFKDMAEQSA